ncbi:hypothetical protein LY76DRAFT_163287 [Colletotrichum caudatum]|nr:hypothetical protein LY76DRAFT_163287 [Colletotrichum caudatum]
MPHNLDSFPPTTNQIHLFPRRSLARTKKSSASAATNPRKILPSPFSEQSLRLPHASFSSRPTAPRPGTRVFFFSVLVRHSRTPSLAESRSAGCTSSSSYSPLLLSSTSPCRLSSLCSKGSLFIG